MTSILISNNIERGFQTMQKNMADILEEALSQALT